MPEIQLFDEFPVPAILGRWEPPRDVTQDIVRGFLPTTARFFLHGSRSKLPHRLLGEGTDWDFAAQKTPELFEELGRLGFELIHGEYYPGDQVFELINLGHKVQVSLKDDLDSYVAVWQRIPPILYQTFLWKRSPRFIGKSALRALLHTMEDIYRAGQNLGKLPDLEDLL